MSFNEAQKSYFTVVSAVEAELGPGSLGMDEEGTRYMKVKAENADVQVDVAVKASTTAAEVVRLGGDNGDYLVPLAVVTTDAAADAEALIGWNKTGQIVTQDDYYWATTGPIIRQAESNGAIGVGVGVDLDAAGEVEVKGGGTGDTIGTSLTAAANSKVDILLLRSN